jgi:2'-5' RNA ligase
MSRSWSAPSARLFVAFDLPLDVERAVSDWQEAELESRDDVRLAQVLHVTLCFLGDRPQTELPAVVQALETIAFSQLEVRFSEPLFLPERGAKRVLALGLEDDGGLIVLQREVSQSLAALKVYKPDKRPYRAHLTVARFRRPGHTFALQNVNVPAFHLSQMTLYNSLLQRTGAVHTPLAVFPAR